jgi:phosphate:Na+ symporter
VARLQPQVALADEALASAANGLRAHAAQVLALARVDSGGFDPQVLHAAHDAFEAEYQSFKAQLLRAATAGVLPARRMAMTLEQFSAIRRIVDQATKAADYLHRFMGSTQAPPAAGAGVQEQPPAQSHPDQAA